MATAVCGALRGPGALPAGQMALIARVNRIDFAAHAEGLLQIRTSRA